MIDVIFTLDYEIYGNGTGSLLHDVYEPAEKLAALFRQHSARFVVFVEAAELEVLEKAGTDPGIGPVKEQVKRFHREGFEIGLHIHPQWYNARHEDGHWLLDYSEYNLCNLHRARIEAIVDRAILYLRGAVGQRDFTPVSFRAGNWLFQPTQTVAEVLVERGLRVDSSVFKGGLQRANNLDYRTAAGNGDHWYFSDRVEVSDSAGMLLELPIYTKMVPIWQVVTARRMRIQHRASSAGPPHVGRAARLRDFLRLRYPVKLDFCRMGSTDIIQAVAEVAESDSPGVGGYRPLVAIGHTKDLVDLSTVEPLLRHLKDSGVGMTTLDRAQHECGLRAGRV